MSSVEMAFKCVICKKSLKNSKKSRVGTDCIKQLIDVSHQNQDGLHEIFSTARSLELHLTCRNRYTLKKQTGRKNDTQMKINEQFVSGGEVIENDAVEKDMNIDLIDAEAANEDREVVESMSIEEDKETEEYNENAVVGEEIDDFEIIDGMIIEELMTKQARVLQAFEQTCVFMEHCDESEFKIEELLEKMQSYLPSALQAYSKKYFVQKIAEKYGDTIIICKAKGIEHFMCFKDQLDNVISSKILNEKSEAAIINAAIEIIRQDVRTYEIRTDEYPSFDEISNGGEGHLPPKFHHVMNSLLLPKKPLESHKRKSLAIQNAMMSLMRPRYVSPILIGIGTLIHRRTSSRYIVDILNALGFSASYTETLKMQKRAAVEPQRKKLEHAYIQHSWDNADINTRTLNGYGTWHSMGGLECVTPAGCAIVTGNLPRGNFKMSAKELGHYGALSIKTYMKPKENGLKHITIESLELNEDDRTVRCSTSIEFLYLCGRLFDFYFQPSWFGYNAFITKEISGFVQTKTTPLPFINLDPGNLSTIYTALCFTASQCRQLNQSIIFVTFDQPLYIKAVTIIKSANSSSELRKIVVRLGGFHLLMSFLGTIGYIMNGSGLEDLYAQVYAKNTVKHMLTGHAYTRAVRACFLAQEAISHLVLESELTFSEEDKCRLQSIFETFDVSMNEDLNEPLLKKIEITLKTQFENLLDKGRTCKLWIQFWNMVQIVKDFIKAERCGDWNLHIRCVKKMLPYFHAAGRLQYAKCAHIYLQDMLKLKNIMSSEEYTKFVKSSYFTIRRTNNFFAGTWSDMVIEQDLMRALKVSGGLNHGKGTTDNCLAVWMGALPYCLEIMNSVEKFCGKYFTTSEQHVELRTSREEIDRNDFQKFKQWLKEHNPFDQTKPQLYSISTGIVAVPVINCDRAEEIGIKTLKNIIGRNFFEVELNYKKKVKPLGFTMKAVKLNGIDVIINPNQLFTRMLTIMPSLEKLIDSFNFELASYPLSIFNENGMRKSETVSVFKYFDKIQDQCNLEFNKQNAIFIISGDFLLGKVLWNSNQTFCQVIDEYVQYVLYYYGQSNVIIVFDGEKDELSQLNVASAIVHFETHMKISVKQSEFLNNGTNKLRFVGHLQRRFVENNIQIYQAENNSDRLIAKLAVLTAEQRQENIVVVAEDLDILMLLIGHTPTEVENIFMLRPGKCVDSISHITNIQNKLGRVKDVILTVHSFSGTKRTSGFFKKGKITFLKAVMKNDDILDALHVFNESNSENKDLCNVGEKLLLKVYGATKETTSINLHRYELFNKINRKKKLSQEFNLAVLPPSVSAIKPHVMRTYFQVQEWNYNILNPTNWGWHIKDGVCHPLRVCEKVVPDWLMESIACTCKNSCESNCSCQKFKMECTQACTFCRAECSNRFNLSENLCNDDLTDALNDEL